MGKNKDFLGFEAHFLALLKKKKAHQKTTHTFKGNE
jgi:hypothetical protein